MSDYYTKYPGKTYIGGSCFVVQSKPFVDWWMDAYARNKNHVIMLRELYDFKTNGHHGENIMFKIFNLASYMTSEAEKIKKIKSFLNPEISSVYLDSIPVSFEKDKKNEYEYLCIKYKPELKGVIKLPWYLAWMGKFLDIKASYGKQMPIIRMHKGDPYVKKQVQVNGVQHAIIPKSLMDSCLAFHRNGLVHRDIKEPNIIELERKPILNDFGSIYSQQDISQTIALDSLFYEGMTQGYRSPEIKLYLFAHLIKSLNVIKENFELQVDIATKALDGKTFVMDSEFNLGGSLSILSMLLSSIAIYASYENSIKDKVTQLMTQLIDTALDEVKKYYDRNKTSQVTKAVYDLYFNGVSIYTDTHKDKSDDDKLKEWVSWADNVINKVSMWALLVRNDYFALLASHDLAEKQVESKAQQGGAKKSNKKQHTYHFYVSGMRSTSRNIRAHLSMALAAKGHSLSSKMSAKVTHIVYIVRPSVTVQKAIKEKYPNAKWMHISRVK